MYVNIQTTLQVCTLNLCNANLVLWAFIQWHWFWYENPVNQTKLLNCMFYTGASTILHIPFTVAETNTTVKIVSLQTRTGANVKTKSWLLQFLRFEPGPKYPKIRYKTTCKGNRRPRISINSQMETWMEENTCIAISATIAPRHLLQERTYGWNDSNCTHLCLHIK